ncbi:MAG TPA: glycosyltransferase family 2 protein [Acidimicrobiales bacterium]|nr:glycosyltransferase family 2 protein [Acidimicrobiales bacterium]
MSADALVREQAAPVPVPPPVRPARAGRTLVILPALNEEECLTGVLRELAGACPDLDVLVVDDGSTDATAEVARAEGVPVAVLPFNLGVGGALQTGFRYAVAHGYGRAIQFDADGQHDPTQVPALLAALDEGADLVIGSRFAAPEPGSTYDVGRLRGGAMGILRVAVRLLSGRSFSDTSSGFRAFSAPLLGFYAAEYPNEYLGDTVEALLLACQAGFRVVEVPVTMRVRAGGTPSTQNVKLAYHYLRALLSLLSRAPIRRRERAQRRRVKRQP